MELDPWKLLQEHILADYTNHEASKYLFVRTGFFFFCMGFDGCSNTICLYVFMICIEFDILRLYFLFITMRSQLWSSLEEMIGYICEHFIQLPVEDALGMLSF